MPRPQPRQIKLESLGVGPIYVLVFLFLFFFWPHCTACGILVPHVGLYSWTRDETRALCSGSAES